MPRSTYQRLLGFLGKLAVLLILGFLVLPAAVVTIAAFNDKAILSFPPQAWSLRWFARAIRRRISNNWWPALGRITAI